MLYGMFAASNGSVYLTHGVLDRDPKLVATDLQPEHAAQLADRLNKLMRADLFEDCTRPDRMVAVIMTKTELDSRVCEAVDWCFDNDLVENADVLGKVSELLLEDRG